MFFHLLRRSYRRDKNMHGKHYELKYVDPTIFSPLVSAVDSKLLVNKYTIEKHDKKEFPYTFHSPVHGQP